MFSSTTLKFFDCGTPDTKRERQSERGCVREREGGSEGVRERELWGAVLWGAPAANLILPARSCTTVDGSGTLLQPPRPCSLATASPPQPPATRCLPRRFKVFEGKGRCEEEEEEFMDMTEMKR